jgi:hypothetical protein
MHGKSIVRFSYVLYTVHGAGETFSAKYRIYLQPAHRRGLLLYVGPRVRPPAASPLTEYGGTIGSMFGMML